MEKGTGTPPPRPQKGIKRLPLKQSVCVVCHLSEEGNTPDSADSLIRIVFLLSRHCPLSILRKNELLLNSLKERKRPVKHHYHSMCFSKNFMALHRCVFISKIWNFPLFLLWVPDHIKNHLCKEEGISQNKSTTPKLQRKPAGYGVIRT